MRRTKALSLILILSVTFGCAGVQEDVSQGPSPSSDQNEEVSEPAKEEEPKTEPQTAKEPDIVKESQQEPAVIDLSGDGQTATDPFTLEAGLAIFRTSYRGEGNFVAWLFDETGARVENGLVANEVGSFDGSQAVQAKGGQYLLDVQARGPWTITIEQPRPTSAPQTANFTYPTGKTATDFFHLSRGLEKFSFAHEGSKNFTVWLLDKNGARVNGGLLANEIGPFEGSKAVQIPKDDIYLLQVEADGYWRVEWEGVFLTSQ